MIIKNNLFIKSNDSKTKTAKKHTGDHIQGFYAVHEILEVLHQ